MKREKPYYKYLLLLFLPMGILLSYSSAFVPNLIENVYSQGIYRPLSRILSSVTGVFHFSLAEIIIIFIVLFVIFLIIAAIRNVVISPEHRKKILYSFIMNIFIYAGIVYFLFIILWGLNYSRLPFGKLTGMDTKPASVKELEDVCVNIAKKANELRNNIHEDQYGVMQTSTSKNEVLLRAFKGYDNASKIYSILEGRYGNPKPVFFSNTMSYTGISGVYFPFTGEANVNTYTPDSLFPATACHEMAHQRGFAREDEANYIAYLTCSMHPDVDFQYSGTLLALINAGNALYAHDPERYKSLQKIYSPGIRRDLEYHNNFWKKYEGPVEEISNKINDTYLKANRQNDGVYSYGRMVDLLIAEYRLKTR